MVKIMATDDSTEQSMWATFTSYFGVSSANRFHSFATKLQAEHHGAKLKASDSGNQTYTPIKYYREKIKW